MPQLDGLAPLMGRSVFAAHQGPGGTSFDEEGVHGRVARGAVYLTFCLDVAAANVLTAASVTTLP